MRPHPLACAAALICAGFGCGSAAAPTTSAADEAPVNHPLVWTRDVPAEPAPSARLPARAPDTGGTSPSPGALADAPSPEPEPELEPAGNETVAQALAATRPYGALIERVSDELGLDARLVHAVVSVESNYNASSVSPKGAIGLMQVMPATGRSLGFTNLRDAGTNLRAGVTYLKSLLERYDDDIALALAAYNAGAGAVDRHGYAIPPYDETRNYVRKVLARYREAGGEAAVPSDDASSAGGSLRGTALGLAQRGTRTADSARPRGAPTAGAAAHGEPWSALRKLGSLMLSAPVD